MLRRSSVAMREARSDDRAVIAGLRRVIFLCVALRLEEWDGDYLVRKRLSERCFYSMTANFQVLFWLLVLASLSGDKSSPHLRSIADSEYSQLTNNSSHIQIPSLRHPHRSRCLRDVPFRPNEIRRSDPVGLCMKVCRREQT